MLKLLKNVFLTALMVAGATVATSACAAVGVLLVASSQSETLPSEMMAFGAAASIVMGALVGVFFSVVPLFIAAVTMPPALWLMRALKLPRPLLDCIGGGAAGLLCAAAAMATLESIARSKGGGLPGHDVRLVLDVCGMVGGAVLGYLRHVVLVRKHEAPAAPELVYQA